MDCNSLVEAGTRRYGSFAARPQVVNPLDQWSGVERRLRRLRLKEWIYFTLIHPELFSAMVIQDAGYVSSSEIYASLVADGTLHQHARTGLGGSLQMPAELYGSRCRFVSRGFEIFYEFGSDHGEHRIEIRTTAHRSGAALDASLVLHGDRASAPLSVSSRLPGGSMYTHKRAFPVSGVYRVGNTAVTFDPARDLALLDEHKSLLPYRTSWIWGTFARVDDGSILGANLITRPELPDEAQESCIWADGGVGARRDVCFTAVDGRSGAWRVSCPDGSVDLRFEPSGIKHVKRQLLVAAVDYHQTFGSYSGTVGDRPISDVHGVVEEMQARF